MKFRGQDLAPLHVIAWRLIWYGPYMILKVLLFLVILMCWGRYEATQFWEQMA